MSVDHEQAIQQVMDELRPDNPELSDAELRSAAEAVLIFRTPDREMVVEETDGQGG